MIGRVRASCDSAHATSSHGLTTGSSSMSARRDGGPRLCRRCIAPIHFEMMTLRLAGKSPGRIDLGSRQAGDPPASSRASGHRSAAERASPTNEVDGSPVIGQRGYHPRAGCRPAPLIQLPARTSRPSRRSGSSAMHSGSPQCRRAPMRSSHTAVLYACM